MRKIRSWIVLSVVIAAANASERSIAAQRLGCGTKTPPPEIEAHEVFREAFLRVALMHLPDWQFQPTRPRGPSAAGRPPLGGENMVWMRDKSQVRIQYWRLASIEDATARLCWHREVIPEGTRLVASFGDEAYEPPTYTRQHGNLYYRRGAFMFAVSLRLEPDVKNWPDNSMPGSITNPAIDIARLF